MKQLMRILRFVKPYTPLIVLSVISAAASVVCTLLAPLIIGQTIDSMVGAHQVDFARVMNRLMILSLLYAGSCFFLWLLTYLTNRISYGTINRLRDALFSKLARLPLGFYDITAHGDTTSRFINDADTIADGMLQGIVALLQGVATIIGAVIFMLSINTAMAAAVILSAPATYLVARFITLKSQQLFGSQAKHLGELNGFAEEMIDGLKVVKAYRREERTLARFSEINDRLNETGFKAQFISALSNPSTRIVNNITYAVIGVIGAVSAIRGTISVGDISSFLIFAIIFGKPFNEITGVLTQMQAAAASAKRVFEILDMDTETPDPQGAQLKNCTGHVQFDNVSFSYTPGQRLIENFNLDVPAGSHVAIVGRTGAGKTTLVNLLMRFYDVSAGAIRIDGIDIRTLPRDMLRSQFAMVLQETWLFGGTIRENIAYARPDASLDEIVRAARAAGADGFIRRLENGYDTLISPEGGSLSQGQMQLLTIARAMLVDPPMLILDEATSNIDTYTEQRIQRAFAKLTQGRTSFVIAHRLSTIKNADIILVMEKGQVVESGTHSELLAQNGQYASLYNSQFAAGKA